MTDVFHMFSYAFIQRALLVGVLVSLCSALLGVSLVLKRYSMIGDGLSHVGFGALAVAAALGLAPLKAAIPVVIIAAFFLLRLSESSSIKGDSAIALVSSGALAVGIVVVSAVSGMNTDIMNYMFGSILSVGTEDAFLSIVISLIVLILYVLLFNRIFAVTFDENFAKASGVRVGLFNTILAVLTAVTIVIGMRMMGALLISSLIIFPSLTAMRVCKRFKPVVITSAILSVLTFLIGFMLSYIFETPTGATIVCVDVLVFILFSIIGRFKACRVSVQ